MNTANKLTMLRVALIPVFLILLYLRFPFHMYFARTMTTRSTQAGKRPASTNQSRAAMTSTLSARGSINLPKSVTWL